MNCLTHSTILSNFFFFHMKLDYFFEEHSWLNLLSSLSFISEVLSFYYLNFYHIDCLSFSNDSVRTVHLILQMQILISFENWQAILYMEALSSKDSKLAKLLFSDEKLFNFFIKVLNYLYYQSKISFDLNHYNLYLPCIIFEEVLYLRTTFFCRQKSILEWMAFKTLPFLTQGIENY